MPASGRLRSIMALPRATLRAPRQASSVRGEAGGEGQHHDTDDTVEHPPGPRRPENRREPARGIAEGEEEDEARGDCARPEEEALSVPGGRERADENEGVEIDMRVEPGEGEAREHRLAKASGRLALLRHRMPAAPGRPPRHQPVDGEKGDPTPEKHGLHPRRRFGARRDEQGIGDRAGQADREDMASPEPLAQHERILCPYREDQAETDGETGEISGHDGRRNGGIEDPPQASAPSRARSVRERPPSRPGPEPFAARPLDRVSGRGETTFTALPKRRKTYDVDRPSRPTLGRGAARLRRARPSGSVNAQEAGLSRRESSGRGRRLAEVSRTRPPCRTTGPAPESRDTIQRARPHGCPCRAS